MKVRHLILFFLFFGVSRGAEPKPVLAILEINPWMYRPDGGLTFALYDDGSIVYRREKSTNEEPLVHEPLYTRRVIETKGNAVDFLGFDPSRMEAQYRLSAWTDRVTTVIWTPSKKMEVYGDWRKIPELDNDPDPRFKAMAERERKMWESLPKEVRGLLRRIDRERSIEGEMWIPARIEVVFWFSEYATGGSIVWPKDWPGLSTAGARQRGKSVSVFLPSEHLAELQSFLATQPENGTVLIDGKKMVVDTRFPLPGEEAWMP